jgi:transcriptional regulator with XRE-family HTH domain
MTDKTFADRLLAHRSLLELSQDQVGDLLGVSSQTVSNWEAGTIPRKARVAQAEAWMASGKVTKAEPVKLGDAGPISATPVSKEIEDLRKISATLRKQQLDDAREQRRLERRAARDAEIKTFVDDLIAPLRQHANPPIEVYKHLRLVRDYLSPNLSVKIVFINPDALTPPPLEGAVLTAAALKALDVEKSQSRVLNTLVVIGAAPEVQAREISLTAIASLLGVGIHFVPDASAAAAVVIELESIAVLL